MSAELNPDKPISRKEDDLLGRHPLAYRIADMINNLGDDYKDSVVIGIEGEWGSGKSSFINLMLNRVRPEKKNLVIEFNPWNFSAQDELIKDFFTSMVDKLKDNNKGLIGNIKKYVSRLKMPDKIVVAPSVGDNSVGSLEWNLDGKPLKKQKDEIDEDLKKLEQRIIIVIEDIDRLDSNETKLIFKLVRLIADFPNTVFMLAYDRNRVADRLAENGIYGEEYLKKIIQVPFLIPKPAKEDIQSVLISSIIKELRRHGPDENWDTEGFRHLVESDEFSRFFPTIRDIRRYTNSLRLDLKIIGKEEVNLVDFVGIEAIRVFAPEVYMAMTSEKIVFTARNKPDWVTDKPKWQETHRQTRERIIGMAPERLKNSIEEIINQRFPQLKGDGDPEEQQMWNKKLRVCSEDMFDRYFSLSVPPTLLSESEFGDFLLAVNDIPALLDKWDKFWERGKLQIVFDRLRDHLDDLNGQQRENLLVSLFDFVEGVGYGESGILSFGGLFDSTYEGRRIVFTILRKFERGKRVEFLMKLINTTEGFFLMTKFLDDLEAEQSEYTSQEGEEPSLFSDEMDILRTAYVAKIKKAVDNGSLIHGKQWGQTLLAWKEWGVKGEAEAYIAELLKTDENLPAVLRGFTVKVTTVAKDEAKLKRTREINKGALGRVTDLEKINKRVEELDVNNLSEEDAKVVELYKNQPEDSEDIVPPYL